MSGSTLRSTGRPTPAGGSWSTPSTATSPPRAISLAARRPRRKVKRHPPDSCRGPARGRRGRPRSSDAALRYAGIVILVLGTFFRLGRMLALGGRLSHFVAVQKDHPLLRTRFWIPPLAARR